MCRSSRALAAALLSHPSALQRVMAAATATAAAIRFRAALGASRDLLVALQLQQCSTTAAPSFTDRGLHLVLGNEAADADSCVSALVYAYSLRARWEDAGRAGPQPLGIISCPRSDFFMRREASYLLERCLARGKEGASPISLDSQLVFLDDVEAPTVLRQLLALSAAGTLRLTLVDHNKLMGKLAAAGLGPSVCEIIDHHRDGGDHPRVVGGERRISFDVAVGKGVGSTCTLIAARLLEDQQSRPAQAEDAVPTSSVSTPVAAAGCAPSLIDAPIAEMLLGVILLDTDGLSATSGKTTMEDVAAAAELREIAALSESG